MSFSVRAPVTATAVLAVLALMLPAVLVPGIAHAASPQATLIPTDPDTDDRFGLAVAVDGDTAVIGAELDQEAGRATGAAYVFVRTDEGWVQQGKLLASDPGPGDRFGYAVAINGDRIVVGGFHNDDSGPDSGAAYVFERNETDWSETAKLVASDAAANDQFGQAVAVSGDTIVITANSLGSREPNPDKPGAAYVFVPGESGWEEQATLRSPAVDDFFGRSAAIDGETIVVGADGDDASAPDAGALYVYIRTGGGWDSGTKIVATDAGGGDRFGRSVAIDGHTLVTGANSDDDIATNAGAVYVIIRSGDKWTQEVELFAEGAARSDFFGTSVDVSGEAIVVGAPLRDEGPSDTGAAYLFVRGEGGWAQQDTLTHDDPAAQDEFGRAVGVSGTTAIVGAGLRDGVGPNSGAAYAFALPEPDDGGGDGGGDGDADGDGITDTPPPTDKKDCKKRGWREFNNPTFRNQGACIKYVKQHS